MQTCLFACVLSSRRTAYSLSSLRAQYFEPALVPNVHYVPLWVDGIDDMVPVLQALEA